MHQGNRFLILVIIFLLLGFSVGYTGSKVISKPGTTTTIILIRHAERDNFFILTAQGHKRAKALLDAVKDMGITAIYSPNFERDLDTVKMARPLEPPKSIARKLMVSDMVAIVLFIHRPKIFTGAIIRPFQIHAEAIPGAGSENFIFGHIVHTHRNSQHGGQCHQIRSNMTIGDGSMIRPPVCHDRIGIFKSALTGQAGRKPSRGPGWIRTLI